jgi:hypothetical protein
MIGPTFGLRDLMVGMFLLHTHSGEDVQRRAIAPGVQHEPVLPHVVGAVGDGHIEGSLGRKPGAEEEQGQDTKDAFHDGYVGSFGLLDQGGIFPNFGIWPP